jgi:hypothetical protein
MPVNNKHLATLLLGAAAALGAYKYMNLSEEEKEKLAAQLKEQANKLKKSATDAEEQALDYFQELKTKGADAMKEYLPKMEEFFDSLFKGGNKATTEASTGTGTAESTPSGAGAQ